jgi:hypothetical protein
MVPQQASKSVKLPQEIRAQRESKIFPLNLTAQAEYLVDGNPVVTRPEDTVANCFPGLEADIRNLDRRFFPGLVFEFAVDGAKLAYVDALEDPDLDVRNEQPPDPHTGLAKKLYAKLADDDIRKALEQGNPLPGGKNHLSTSGAWYLDWIEIERPSDGRRRSRKMKRKANRSRTRRRHHLAMPTTKDNNPVWRIVRGLEPVDVSIGLRLRNVRGVTRKYGELRLDGWRRRYTDPTTGVINLAYQPGELGQGLCSPWQHDFRDCQCFYWAANHPDIALGELYPGEALPQDSSVLAANPSPGKSTPPDRPSQGEPVLANVPLDWIRRDRSRSSTAGALGTIAANRPYQVDHFEINNRWQDLSIVLEGREIGTVYVPQSIDTANPYSSDDELIEKLRKELAPLELALAFEYLYAYFSLLDESDKALKKKEDSYGAVVLTRQHLMLTATSEMQHLHWVNQMLWELRPKTYEPVLTAADQVPTNREGIRTQQLVREADDARRELRSGKNQKKLAAAENTALTAIRLFTHMESGGGSPQVRTLQKGNAAQDNQGIMRKAEERRLEPYVIADFISVEHVSGYIDSAYARVVATLRDSRPEMAELAMRIAADGVQHEINFREIKAALSPFFKDTGRYLRRVEKPQDAKAAEKVKRARQLLKQIKTKLTIAYRLAGSGAIERSGQYIGDARTAMTDLLDEGERLASKGIGIPFFDIWKSLP